VSRERFELLRAIREPVKEDDAARRCRAVLVEARIRARIDGGIRGIARDEVADALARVVERRVRPDLRAGCA
jgi:hypothetical protein